MSNVMIDFVRNGVTKSIQSECSMLEEKCFSRTKDCNGGCVCKDAVDALVILICRDFLEEEDQYNSEMKSDKMINKTKYNRFHKYSNIIESMCTSLENQESLIILANKCSDCLNMSSPLEKSLYKKFGKFITKKCKHNFNMRNLELC